MQFNDPSLFIQDAFIDGKWVPKDDTFDVYGAYRLPGTCETISDSGR